MQVSVLNNLLTQNFSGLPVKEFLQQVTAAHPYFTPAQFYLLQQLTPINEGYAEQAARTALLFNNPHWLQFQLQHMAEPSAEKQTPVIAMYAENSDNDDDTAEITAAAQNITAAQTYALPKEPEKITHETAEEAAANQTEAATVTEETAPQPDIKIDLAAAIKNAENDNALAFEPMHLVDYFASQGIKLSDEVQTADKLGKQLKSFSEWLKTMKKVHIPEGNTNAGLSDMVIQTLAAKSNTENEILTEAMAVVFAQQGKAGKAIELYQKLSLLNPSKSAYFAAKIEQLKGE